jgi:hypothetical protein
MPNYVSVVGERMKLTADRLSTSASFRATLYRPDPVYAYMYKLTIKLGIRLRQAYPGPTVQDRNGTTFSLLPWTGPDWQTFVNGAKAQANMWNNRFWLKPPPGVDDYDFTHPKFDHAFRPYIACELDVDLNADAADADRTIDVYNLDLSKITGDQDGGTFPSSAVLFDSLDTIPWVTGYRDQTGAPIMHYTIAHEIGHAIGQPHIGVMRRTPLCVTAMNLKDIGFGKDGQNAVDCYAGDQPSLAGNVMGWGGAITEDNAISWLWAIRYLRGNRIEGSWQVLTSKPPVEGEWVQR